MPLAHTAPTILIAPIIPIAASRLPVQTHSQRIHPFPPREPGARHIDQVFKQFIAEDIARRLEAGRKYGPPWGKYAQHMQ
ncbi:uncharacterized protein SCHCODRAFT_02608968 [Schizophyllum commune H4-8]|uniref:uncharacterized protein n=1 Tax=Schizophyllum commune (strain H4-8 / FGSC 9210) TaxID=578458 RepID=UPI00215F13F0|nr:uncharacterized protein SCHCODRAFT_02608968 [Schizophyllum commune H4-8]KAI5900869.1 hypothetical protein SCHCODRAFT_02608968 [Schizophyllum commune H4-8]